MTNLIQRLNLLGQSVWYDNISRRLLESGELRALVERGEISGITSNPAIFQNAIAKSKDYDSALITMAWAGYTTEQIYEQLVLEDIRAAADLFLPIYRATNGYDGYVSLEVSPRLAYDSTGTLVEARRLWQLVDRPNLMIKIPGTKEGLKAVKEAIADGINVNVTLIFSLKRYREVMEAYLDGIEARLNEDKPVGTIASVASFFVSRIDSKVDKLLERMMSQGGEDADRARNLLGKAAVASGRLAYQQFKEVFNSERFARLRARGARLQRPLWASTSIKNPAYSDTLYVDNLIGKDTINTMPPQTLEAFRDHGVVRLTIEEDLAGAQEVFARLESLGISMKQVTEELEQEGVKAFLDAFEALSMTLDKRRSEAQGELGQLAQAVSRRVAEFEVQRFPARLHTIDPNLWTDNPVGQVEIRQRLGWLNLPERSQKLIPELERFSTEVRKAGFTHALLLGMGGSSLAPEVMAGVFRSNVDGALQDGLELRILDSTDPGQVRATMRWAPTRKTLYIVSSKSGGTAEVNAFLDAFWARTKRSLGDRAGEHFIAITDPGTSLEELARERGFRRVFLADPQVGGRFSALSAFGLVPAALMGLNLNKLLDRAAWMARQCAVEVPAGRNPGLVLGAILGEAALVGRDKLTLVTDRLMESFGAWLEQLIAESSGKNGKGIIPIVGEPLRRDGLYGRDRLFVYLRTDGLHDRALARLREQGYPTLILNVASREDLAAEFYRWEVATAAACAVLRVNAFDQPDVQDNKIRTVEKIRTYQQVGKLDEGEPAWEAEGVKLFGQIKAPEVMSVGQALDAFLGEAQEGDYLAINAYLPRNVRTNRILQRLRVAIHKRTNLATTFGFGPRFLHSTGQLHKGGPATVLILQITVDPAVDLPIPGQGLTFGILERAQALGDLQALQMRGRRVMRLHFLSLAKLEAEVQAWIGR